MLCLDPLSCPGQVSAGNFIRQRNFLPAEEFQMWIQLTEGNTSVCLHSILNKGS